MYNYRKTMMLNYSVFSLNSSLMYQRVIDPVPEWVKKQLCFYK
ncbi:hypothetical protein CPJCM30710_11700 [Clostridium polyendosporum]|uniref:Uncharacterized protein n=1 Tax=Clostridium polyendosporum TaxID=69208 RepID=A0A919RZ84_9CLOT|nr:hypothetical protein CPJCM30710_11700 [Clostridium polyendosporum]